MFTKIVKLKSKLATVATGVFAASFSALSFAAVTPQTGTTAADVFGNLMRSLESFSWPILAVSVVAGTCLIGSGISQMRHASLADTRGEGGYVKPLTKIGVGAGLLALMYFGNVAVNSSAGVGTLSDAQILAQNGGSAPSTPIGSL